MKRSTFSAKITGRWLRWIYVLCYFKINKIRPTEMHNKLCKSCDMCDKRVWSALYPISNHSHIRQLQFATHAFSQQVLQQAVQISICQWSSLRLLLKDTILIGIYNKTLYGPDCNVLFACCRTNSFLCFLKNSNCYENFLSPAIFLHSDSKFPSCSRSL